MAKVKQVAAQIVPTETPYRRGGLLLGCFVPGESKPKASHQKQVIEIIVATAKELKELGEEPTPENYAKHLRMKNNLPVVKNALLFCTNDPEGSKRLQEILNPSEKAQVPVKKLSGVLGSPIRPTDKKNLDEDRNLVITEAEKQGGKNPYFSRVLETASPFPSSVQEELDRQELPPQKALFDD